MWYVREMRKKAYAQLLESHRVVGLESMANAFGVSNEVSTDSTNSIACCRIKFSCSLADPSLVSATVDETKPTPAL